MKRFIVKDVVCDYGVFDTQYKDGEHLDCICNAKANAVLIADILNVDYSKPNECSYWSDFILEQNSELKQQLAEKDKEIKELKAYKKGAYEKYVAKCSYLQNQIKDEKEKCEKLIRRLNLITKYKDDQKQRADKYYSEIKKICKQVCDEIREKIKQLIKNKDFSLYSWEYGNGLCYGLQYDMAAILDQIEKGE